MASPGYRTAQICKLTNHEGNLHQTCKSADLDILHGIIEEVQKNIVLSSFSYTTEYRSFSRIPITEIAEHYETIIYKLCEKKKNIFTLKTMFEAKREGDSLL